MLILDHLGQIGAGNVSALDYHKAIAPWEFAEIN